MKLFFDTNIFIRFLTRDDEQLYTGCVRIMEYVQMGKIIPYTSNIVILELFFLLTRQYKLPHQEVLDDIQKLLTLRNLTLVEKSDTKKALTLVANHTIKFADCLIATQIPASTRLLTYDRDFEKLPDIDTITPVDALAALQN